MKELFKEILEIDNVQGAMLLSPEGKLLFQDVSASEGVKSMDWTPFIKALEEVREAELVFEEGVLYIRNSAAGYVVVLLGPFASISMVRLNCDALMPALEKQASKGLMRFFRRK